MEPNLAQAFQGAFRNPDGKPVVPGRAFQIIKAFGQLEGRRILAESKKTPSFGGADLGLPDEPGTKRPMLWLSAPYFSKMAEILRFAENGQVPLWRPG